MSADAPQPWFQEGLRFKCTMCGKCCTGAPGVVWANDDEVPRIAAFLGITSGQLEEWYTRMIGNRRALVEKKNFDCVFYDRAQGCTIYPVRPGQCRTWPFWESNLSSPQTWQSTCAVCPGSGHDQGELIPAEEIVRRMKVIKI